MRTLAPLLLLLVACGEPAPLNGEGDGSVHPTGWSEAGHGQHLRAGGYDLQECAGCHPAASTAPGNCTECHEQGVSACDTCHATLSDPHPSHTGFDCVTCHEVPDAIHSPGHVTDRGDGDVRFSGPAAARGFSPKYSAGACQDVACHAGPGATTPSPTWAAGALGCDGCHGAPPPAHPADRCNRCHTGVDAKGREILDAATHVDGQVQITMDWRTADCDACHGAQGDPGLDGEPDPGAHTAHLAATSAAPLACETCHVVPERVDAPGHLTEDDTPGVAEVRLTGVGSDASYAGGRCSDTTCHGGDRPFWVGGDAPCGTCHAVPPPRPAHPAGAECGRCHLTAGPDRTFADPLGHVDGQLDVDRLSAADCAICHGAGGRATPAGSHSAHARFDCSTCHTLPDPADVGAHLDGVARVALQPGSASAGTCSDTTCHGAGQPLWGDATTVDGCGACHGNPPAGHALGDCSGCHPAADSPTHVDATVQVVLPAACDACHGEPPESGAHLAHISGEIGRVVECGECHTVPAQTDAPGHLDAPPAEVHPLGGEYTPEGCTNTTCHAGPDGSRPTPAWEDGPEAAECGACHGVPPQGHPAGNCAQCHGAVIDAEGAIIRPRLHVNGEVDFR